MPEEFRNKVKPLIEKYKKQVTYYGPYESKDLPGLMQEIDWVVMPSVWWENSPLVIQEAFKYGRPMIVSNIGGLAEKVVDKQDGLHFRAGNAMDLAEKIESIAVNNLMWDSLQEGLPITLNTKQCAEEHLKLYD